MSSTLAVFCLFSLRKGAEHLFDDGLDLILLVLGEAGHEVLDAGAEDGRILRAHVKDHDGLAFGQVIVAQAIDQTGDGETIVREWLLAKRIG